MLPFSDGITSICKIFSKIIPNYLWIYKTYLHNLLLANLHHGKRIYLYFQRQLNAIPLFTLLTTLIKFSIKIISKGFTYLYVFFF